VEIIDPKLRRKMKTVKEGSCSTIVWNPWSDGAASMRDLGDEEWREMLCVEGGNILSSAVTLAPARDHILTIVISVDE
jgi:glucose-6-phosphate 1-epimerase